LTPRDDVSVVYGDGSVVDEDGFCLNQMEPIFPSIWGCWHSVSIPYRRQFWGYQHTRIVASSSKCWEWTSISSGLASQFTHDEVKIWNNSTIAYLTYLLLLWCTTCYYCSIIWLCCHSLSVVCS
jgi:hypothetical protein